LSRIDDILNDMHSFTGQCGFVFCENKC